MIGGEPNAGSRKTRFLAEAWPSVWQRSQYPARVPAGPWVKHKWGRVDLSEGWQQQVTHSSLCGGSFIRRGKEFYFKEKV